MQAAIAWLLHPVWWWLCCMVVVIVCMYNYIYMLVCVCVCERVVCVSMWCVCV